MDNALKRTLRKSRAILNVYWTIKKILIFPLRFTSYQILRPMKIPFLDYFDNKRMKLLKIVAPYTKAGYPRMSSLYNLATEIEEKKIEGSFVECGTWKGGCCAIMGGIAKKYGSKRKTYYIDSFEGMPEKASEKDGKGTERIQGDTLKASTDDVKELIFDKLDLNKEKNILVKGWFQDTLPKVKNDIGKIAILRMDADWYEATIFCLRELYDQIADGGYIIFDDYGTWEGCKKAVHEFVEERKLDVEFEFIGTQKKGVMYFKKK